MTAPSRTVQPTHKVRLVYILAASHSGSTLLAMLLASHPEICTVGELKATSLGDLDRYLCSCRRKILECPFWNGIRQDMAERGFNFDISNAGTDIRSGASPYVRKLLRPLHRGPLAELARDFFLSLSPVWRKQLPIIQALNANLMDCVLSRTGAHVIVDSSKIGIRLKYLLANPMLDVKVIRLVRDGRGVALTYMDPAVYADATDPNLRGGGRGGNRASERLSMAQAAYEWRRSNEEGEAIVRRLDPSTWRIVTYENLCTDTQETMQRLYEFLGLNPSHRIENFRGVDQHVIGNGMRLDTSNEIRLNEEWRKVLSKADLDTFESVSGGLSRRLGYA
jgi:hypothetical protein